MLAMITTLLTFYVSQNNIITLLIAIEILLSTVIVKIIWSYNTDYQATSSSVYL